MMVPSLLVGLLAAAASALPAAEPASVGASVDISTLPPADASKFTYYPVSAFSGPCDLTTGPDGAIWGQDIIENKIVRLDVNTGMIEEFPIHYHDHVPDNFTLADLVPEKVAFACAIQPGDDGNLYAASGVRGQFVRIKPDTKEITVFQPPFPANLASNLEPFNDLYAAPEGMYFTLTTANVLFLFKYDTEEFISYEVPTPAAGPLGTFLASDGNIWICEFFANKIAKFDRQTKKFTEYPLPVRDFGPAVVRAESPKDRIWFTGLIGQSMGSIDITNGDIKVIPDNALPPGSPTEDTVDKDGFVWYSTLSRPTLNKLDPNAGTIEYIRQPTLNPLALTIACHYGPLNSIWFTETLNSRIGRYQL